jgi:hypothetical protein
VEDVLVYSGTITAGDRLFYVGYSLFTEDGKPNITTSLSPYKITVSDTKKLQDALYFTIKYPPSLRLASVKGLRTKRPNQSIVIPSAFTDRLSGVEYIVNKIEDFAFMDIGLVAVEIPNTIKEIGIRAFAGNFLQTVEIPKSVVKIGEDAFRESNLTSVIFKGNYSDDFESTIFLNNPFLDEIKAAKNTIGWENIFFDNGENMIPVTVLGDLP